MAAELDHFYTYGDVYAALDTCEELELLLNRLQRQQLWRDQECRHTRDHVREVRSRLEKILPAPSTSGHQPAFA